MANSFFRRVDKKRPRTSDLYRRGAAGDIARGFWEAPTSGGSTRPWVPSDLGSALKAWYDASDAATVTGSAPVTQWDDKSGNSNHLVPYSSGKGPARITAALNGLAVMRFDGTDDGLIDTSFSISGTGNPATTFAVVLDADDASDSILLNNAPPSNNGYSGNILEYGGYISFKIGGQNSAYAYYEDDLTARILIASGDRVSRTLYFDDRTPIYDAPTNSSACGVQALGSFAVGFFEDGPSGFYDGDISEIVVTDTVLSTDDRNKLAGYLAHKWGTTAKLDSGHPYKSAAPTVSGGGTTYTLTADAGAYALTGVAATLTYAPGAWSPTLKGSGITLSNGNLTATNGAAFQNYQNVLGTNGASSGKLYLKLTGLVVADKLETAVGIANASQALEGGSNWLGANGSTTGTSLYFDGTPVHNGAALGDLPDLPTPTCYLEFDLDAQTVRVSPDGSTWGSTAPFTKPSGTVYPAMSFGSTSDAATADFGWLPAGGTTYTLTADLGTYTVTGVAANTTSARRVMADAGAYALTGAAANTTSARRVTADVGSYSLAGVAAATTSVRRITAAAGAYALTGQDGALTYTPMGTSSYTLTAAPGAYTLTGVAADITSIRRVTAAAGAYSLTGVAASTYTVRRMAADAGAYALTGWDAALTPTVRTTYTLTAEPGAYVVSGYPVADFFTWVEASRLSATWTKATDANTGWSDTSSPTDTWTEA